MITQERLKELLTYNPLTGLFTRNINRHGFYSGTTAGSKTKNGRYIAINLDRKIYLAHRLAWLYVTGNWPKELIDHKDNDGLNNVWINLREATRSENNRNRSASKNNKLGVKGVMKSKHGYIVTLGLGTYKTLDEAKAVYNKAIEIFHGEFAFKQ